MRQRLKACDLVMLLLTFWCFRIQANDASQPATYRNLVDWALQAISEKAEVATPAIKALREAGPAGLEVLLQTHAENLSQLASKSKVVERTPEEQRLIAAIDTVARQKDALSARLYWHTDWTKAAAAAKASGKPILALRLLGNLDEECSCANSRFFRTALYANEAVSKMLREQFVLYWKSVRPVPKLTVDFGDGRKLVRTVTGNSIHYVLDAQGRPLDALPGLYGPRAFLEALERAQDVVRSCGTGMEAEWEGVRRRYHEERIQAVRKAWAADLRALGIPVKASPLDAAVNGRAPTALEAQEIALTKEKVERPLVRAVVPASGTLEAATPDALWSRIGELHGEQARMDAGSRAFLRSKYPDATRANLLSPAKKIQEDPLLRVIRNFERSMAEDTVRNEYVLHRKIHEWFASGAVGLDAEALNEKVYAELFLTPSSDPWLGLVPADTYSALEEGGMSVAK